MVQGWIRAPTKIPYSLDCFLSGIVKISERANNDLAIWLTNEARPDNPAAFAFHEVMSQSLPQSRLPFALHRRFCQKHRSALRLRKCAWQCAKQQAAAKTQSPGSQTSVQYAVSGMVRVSSPSWISKMLQSFFRTASLG